MTDSKDSEFVTLAYGYLEPGDGSCSIKIARSGHPAPMIIRASDEVETIGRPDELLGILDVISVKSVDLRMTSGDVLVLYTVGVIEAHAGEEIYGTERLRALLAECAGLDPKSIVQKVEEDVLDFGGTHATTSPRWPCASIRTRRAAGALLDDHRGDHPEHPVGTFHVRKDVAVERPRSDLRGIDQHVHPLAGGDHDRVLVIGVIQ